MEEEEGEGEGGVNAMWILIAFVFINRIGGRIRTLRAPTCSVISVLFIICVACAYTFDRVGEPHLVFSHFLFRSPLIVEFPQDGKGGD